MARQGGVRAAAARALAAQRGDRAATIGRAVRLAAMELLAAGIEPVEMVAPLTVASDVSARVVAEVAGLDSGDERLVEDVKRYLLFGWREMATRLDVEHFEAWRKANPRGASKT